MRVDATSYQEASDQVLAWAKEAQSRTVCVAAVNNVMIGQRDPLFRSVMNGADLVTPDGMPLVWGLKRLGVPSAGRVYGPHLTPSILSRAAAEGIPVGFYGGSPKVLGDLIRRVSTEYPNLRIAYKVSPPFRQTSRAEEVKTARAINASGARIVFVGLGCPKQELWMARQRGSVRAVMVGIGAAFDFLAGAKRQAPPLLQRSGLEWLFRLATEPRRLWKRYLSQNPRFALLFGYQLLIARITRLRAGSSHRQEAL
jgi:N-acetylglucosaminyldiphosphoundecaprenol N-acetyl-beta-D-mannosaminyltransferase